MNLGNGLLSITGTSGSKVFNTQFTPKTVQIYNNTAATLYFLGGAYTQEAPMPQAKQVAPGASVTLPFVLVEQCFTIWWNIPTAPSGALLVPLEWTDEASSLGGIIPQVSVTNIANPVSIQGTVTVGTITNPVMVEGTVTVGSITNPVNVQGTVTVGSITSTVAVSGTVTVGSITNPVNVQGTVTVGSITSTVAVSGTVTVGSITDTVTVSGSVDVGTITNPVTVNGTVTVGSITSTVAISGTVTVGSITNAIAVTNVGSITETVNVAGSVASAISNDILPSTSLVLMHQASVTVTNLLNGNLFIVSGDTNNTGLFPYQQLGLWDGYVIFIRSSGGNHYTLTAVDADITSAVPSIGGSNYATPAVTWATALPLNPTYNGNPGSAAVTVLSVNAFAANIGNTEWTNNTGATIATDTVTVIVYGIKAQVTNPLSNPVAQQAVNGEFATLSFTNSGTATGPANVSGDGTQVSTTTTILGSGDYVSAITWDNLVLEVGANNVSGGTWNAQAYLQLGSMDIASVGISGTTDGLGHSGTIPAGTLSWGGKAVPNSGIAISIYVQGSSSSGTIAVSSSNVNYGLISMVLESVTPPTEVSQIA